MGTTIENQRRVSGGRLQKKRIKMGTTSQAEGRGMEGRNGKERKSTYVGHDVLKACNLYCFMKTIFYI